MTSLAVDKKKQRVSVSLADRSQLAGHIFLSPFSELGVGEQTVLDALAGEERFIPFVSSEGDFSFLNQCHVVWVATPIADVQPLADPDIPLSTIKVNVYLEDGKRIRGDVVLAMPEGKERLSDMLNHVGAFMVIRDESREVIVNMNYVVRVS